MSPAEETTLGKIEVTLARLETKLDGALATQAKQGRTLDGDDSEDRPGLIKRVYRLELGEKSRRRVFGLLWTAIGSVAAAVAAALVGGGK